MNRPLVGIPCTKQQINGQAEIQSVQSNYINAVERAGGIPLIIPLITDHDKLSAIFNLLDGLLLAGGVDIDPSEYGESAHPQLGEVIKDRDFVELTLAKLAYDSKLPALGICRGIQVMNVALGGSLFQDLPSQLGLDHRNSTDGSPKDGSDGVHEIEIDQPSLLFSVVKQQRTLVNTAHHQAIKVLSANLRATAWAMDSNKTIEALEAVAHPYFFGVQFHPERLSINREIWDQMFANFIQAASSKA